MRRRLGWIRFAAAVAGVLAGGPGILPAAAQEPPAVVEMRIGDHGATTRFVLEMTAAAEFSVFALAGPDRLVVDFPPLVWPDSAAAAPAGLIAAQRHGANDGGGTRIVLELSAPAQVRDVFFLPPTPDHQVRFVLDLEPSGAPGPPAAEAPAPPPEVALTAAGLAVPHPGRKPPPPAVPMVAIDAGHGGIDPGAIGVGGLFEKTITLSVAHRLREALEADGRHRVFLTRADDRFLRLQDRVAAAREAGADLFISLHADSIDESGVHGASVYTLSDRASDRLAEQLASSENRVDALAGFELDPEDEVTATILIDLAQRLTLNHSNTMAQLVVESLVDETGVLSNPHREAGFAVLKAPDVPSVLIELGFLSNRTDADRLGSAEYQRLLAQAIAEAVEAYFDLVGVAPAT